MPPAECGLGEPVGGGRQLHCEAIGTGARVQVSLGSGLPVYLERA